MPPLKVLRRRKRRKQRKLDRVKRTSAAGKRIKAAIGRLNKAIRKAVASLRIDWNGCAPLTGRESRKIRKATRWALRHFDVYVTSTTGGVHSSTSWHYRRKAVDLGASSTAEKARCQRGLYEHFGPAFFLELFGPDNYPWVKNGQTTSGAEGSALEDQHDTHVHAAAG